MITDDTLVTVCAACKMACCWQSVFYCEKYRTANTIKLSVAELRKLDLENESYWDIDPDTGVARK